MRHIYFLLMKKTKVFPYKLYYILQISYICIFIISNENFIMKNNKTISQNVYFCLKLTFFSRYFLNIVNMTIIYFVFFKRVAKKNTLQMRNS